MLYIELIELQGFSYAASPAARSSQSPEAFFRRCSVKKVFLEISQNSQEKVCAGESFLPATLLKKSLWHRRFPVNFAESLRTLFLQNTSGGSFSISDDLHDRFSENSE